MTQALCSLCLPFPAAMGMATSHCPHSFCLEHSSCSLPSILSPYVQTALKSQLRHSSETLSLSTWTWIISQTPCSSPVVFCTVFIVTNLHITLLTPTYPAMTSKGRKPVTIMLLLWHLPLVEWMSEWMNTFQAGNLGILSNNLETQYQVPVAALLFLIPSLVLEFFRISV